MRRCFVALLACVLPVTTPAATSNDLRSRVIVNGDLGDFEPDEWVVDESTVVPEPVGDSRWGADNEISALALTWDDFNVYVGIRVVTASTSLMLVLDSACGGLDGLGNAGPFKRNVEFAGIRPNVVVSAGPIAGEALLATVDCDNPLTTIDAALYQSVYGQDGAADGALEIAIPWDLLGDFERTPAGTRIPAGGGSLRALAIVTAGSGKGAGDAIPNPSVALDGDSTRVAILNNYIELNLDGNGDGLLDVGVSPRTAATFAVSQVEDVGSALPLRVVLVTKLVEPANGVPLSFYATLDPPNYNQSVFLTAGIYSADGQLIRRLFEDEARDLSAGAAPVIDTWDGRDHRGNFAPGGIYVLAVSGGPGANAPKSTTKASFAIIR